MMIAENVVAKKYEGIEKYTLKLKTNMKRSKRKVNSLHVLDFQDHHFLYAQNYM